MHERGFGRDGVGLALGVVAADDDGGGVREGLAADEGDDEVDARDEGDAEGEAVDEEEDGEPDDLGAFGSVFSRVVVLLVLALVWREEGEETEESQGTN